MKNKKSTAQQFMYLAYIEDGNLSLGIKSEYPFTGSEKMDENDYVMYKIIKPTESYHSELTSVQADWVGSGWKIIGQNFETFVKK